MSSAYNTLAFRIALGDDLVESKGPFLTSSHPSVTGSAPITGSFYYENGSGGNEIYSDAFIINSSSVGYGHSIYSALVNPPNVGAYTEVTSKIRIPSQSLVTGSQLSPHISIQEPYDPAYTKDLSYLEVAISPQNAVNDDIINDLGYFNIDEFIGDPAEAASGSYKDLDFLRKDYFKKYIRKQNILDTIKLLSYYDNSLFKMIKDFVPAKARLATGLVIKPNLLERSKYPFLGATTTRPEYSGSMLTLPYLPDLNQKLVSITGSNAEGVEMDTSFTQSILTPTGSITTVQSDQRQSLTGEFGGSIITAYSLPEGNVVYEDDDSLLRYLNPFGNLVQSGDVADKNIPYGTYQTQSYYKPTLLDEIKVDQIQNPGDSEYVISLSSQFLPSGSVTGLNLEFQNLKGSTNYTVSTWVSYTDDYNGEKNRAFFGFAAATQIGANIEFSGKTGSLIETTTIGGRTWYHYEETLFTPPGTVFSQSLNISSSLSFSPVSSIPGYLKWNVGYPVNNTAGRALFTNIQINEGRSTSARIFNSFKVPLNPTFQNVIENRTNDNFLDIDYSTDSVTPVNLNFIEERLLGKIEEKNSTFLNASIQESNYTQTRVINPRYNGSRSVSAKLNVYTPGDSGYGRYPTMGQATDEFGYFKRATVATSGSFPNRTQLELKYLIDGYDNVTKLTRDNNNLFLVQNIFNNREPLVLSLEDQELPYDNSYLNGSQRIYAGGFRFEPILVNYHSFPSRKLILNFPTPVSIPIPNIGTEEADLGTIDLGDYNFDNALLVPNSGQKTIKIQGQIKVPVSRNLLGFEGETLDKALLGFVRGNLSLRYRIKVGIQAANELVSQTGATSIVNSSTFGNYLGVSPSNIQVNKLAEDEIVIKVTYNFTQERDVYVEIPPGISNYLSPLMLGKQTINEANNIEIIPSEVNQLSGVIRLPDLQQEQDNNSYHPSNWNDNTYDPYNPYYNNGYNNSPIDYDIEDTSVLKGLPSTIFVNNVRKSGLLNSRPFYINVTGSVDTGSLYDSTDLNSTFFWERNPQAPYQLTASAQLTRFHKKFIQTGSLNFAASSSIKVSKDELFEIKQGDIFRFTNFHNIPGSTNDSDLPVSFEREVTNIIQNNSFKASGIKPSGSEAYNGGSSRNGTYTYADTRLVIEFDKSTPVPPQACLDYDSSSLAASNPQYIQNFVIYKKIPDETSIVLDVTKNTIRVPESGSLLTSSLDESSDGFILPHYAGKPLKERAGNIIANLKAKNLL